MDDESPMPMWLYWSYDVNIFFEAWKVQNWVQLILSGIFVSLLAILYEFVNSYKQRLTERFQLIVKENDDEIDLSSGDVSSFSISGMTCQACAETIQNILKNTKGVYGAFVSFSSKYAKVSYDSNLISKSGIIDVIKGVNYEATEIENVASANNYTLLKEMKFARIKQTLIHGVYVILLYALMFIVMTYNVPILIFMFIGYFIGMWFFRN